MKIKQIVSVVAAVAATGILCAGVAPAANSAEESAVVSSRSFPKVVSVKKNLLAEASSTAVDDASNWGGIENLNVPETESQAEKEAAAQQQADEQAAQQQAEAANRSSQREALGNSDAAGTADGTGTDSTAGSVEAPAANSSIGAYAAQFVGYPYVYGGNTPAGWDCSGFTQWVFAQFGKNIGRTTYQQVNAGVHVTDPQPGDLMISTDVSHAGIYLGNGLMIHAMNPSTGTQISAVASVVPSSYYYIRVQ
ncbi:peptidase P60 [Bifidobacterium sp. DSM 109957]|uniref:Peptidase P60 n=2 Tax=Bifidobacterium oedipodis TaxID=2675322 RepID=A0A7Y0HRK5_9BIFI|nr:peptidase P60 [Bifidobacterium sp. DSM 109957]